MTTDAVQTSKWLTDIYAPLTDEVTAFDLPVEGTIPVELEGRFVRNGPNPLGPVEPGTYHWFTGDGMVHGVRLRNGGAEWYCARWVRSTKVSEALGETPAPGERHGGFDTANTNVVGLGGRTFALVEAGGTASRALLRPRHARALRLQRHAAERLHRPSEGRSVHR